RIENGIFRITAPSCLSRDTLEKHYLPLLQDAIEQGHRAHMLEKQRACIPDEIVIPLEEKKYSVTVHSDLNQGLQNIAQAETSHYLTFSGIRLICLGFRDTVQIYGATTKKKHLALALQNWAYDRAQTLLIPHIFSLASKYSIELNKVTIRNQKTRWGSCSRQRNNTYNISLNWRSILLPKDLLNHLCQHELCHSFMMNHSNAFHARLMELDSAAEEKERKLAHASKLLPWWATHVEDFQE
ncbi:MAG: M48 family metallopeptidase, partial [Desulfovibrio sp.]|nr:M48 family metallopeptidase [Desulfovibrio sp.]